MDEILESDQFKGGYGRTRLGWQCSIHFMPIVLNKFVVSLFNVRTCCAILSCFKEGNNQVPNFFCVPSRSFPQNHLYHFLRGYVFAPKIWSPNMLN